jgi:hypothetical protein
MQDAKGLGDAEPFLVSEIGGSDPLQFQIDDRFLAAPVVALSHKESIACSIAQRSLRNQKTSQHYLSSCRPS